MYTFWFENKFISLNFILKQKHFFRFFHLTYIYVYNNIHSLANCVCILDQEFKNK